MSAAPMSDLDAMLKRLHLPTVRRLYPDLVLRAEAEGISYRDFLRNNRILALDITRHQKRLVNPALGVTVVVEGTVQSQEPVELVFVTESLKRIDLVITSHEAQAFIRNRINE